MPLSPSMTRALLEQLRHRPNKRLGQNFLIDGNIVRKSLELAQVEAGDTIIEIGPGLGTLTSALLQAGANVWAIEYDTALHAHLEATLSPQWPTTLHLMPGDALERPLAHYDNRLETASFKVVANLPYAISTPWMEKVLAGPLPERFVLMLQKEAADRFTASPGSKIYGGISIFIEGAYLRQPGHRVARSCFYPTPEVDSTLLHLERRAEPYRFSTDQRRLIRNLFTQRRKQIGSLVNKHPEASSLQGWLDGLAQMGLAPTTRPESIPLEAWKQLPRTFLDAQFDGTTPFPGDQDL